jgi:hypothetical protein
VRIRGGLATGRASWGRIRWLARARQFWWEQESCRNPKEFGGIQRNLEESGGNTGIPVLQEFLQKKSLKVAENRNFQDTSKTTFL